MCDLSTCAIGSGIRGSSVRHGGKPRTVWMTRKDPDQSVRLLNTCSFMVCFAQGTFQRALKKQGLAAIRRARIIHLPVLSPTVCSTLTRRASEDKWLFCPRLRVGLVSAQRIIRVGMFTLHL